MVDAEIIEWDDAEVVLGEFYLGELPARLALPPFPDAKLGAGCDVGTKVPDPRPPRFVRVMRSGGTIDGLVIDRPTMVTEAWSNLESDAANLAHFLRSISLAAGRAGAMGSTTIYDDIVELAGPQNLPDPRTGQYRYTFTHEIPMRAAAGD